MAALPVLRPRQVVAALRRAGFVLHHRTGGHAILKNAGGRRVTVPMHNRDLKTGTLRSIIREAGMLVDEFVEWL